MWAYTGIQIQLLCFSFPLPEGFFYTGSFSQMLQQSNVTGWGRRWSGHLQIHETQGN